VPLLEQRALNVGLKLNFSKCEIAGLPVSSRQEWLSPGLDIPDCPPSQATLLGGSLYPSGISEALNTHMSNLVQVVRRLNFMSSHESLFLHRNSLAMPKLLYLLRTSPDDLSAESVAYSVVLRDAVSSVTNTILDDRAWSQATLPVRWGGIGIRCITSIASSAYLSFDLC